jgi:hypothetical protein
LADNRRGLAYVGVRLRHTAILSTACRDSTILEIRQ